MRVERLHVVRQHLQRSNGSKDVRTNQSVFRSLDQWWRDWQEAKTALGTGFSGDP